MKRHALVWGLLALLILSSVDGVVALRQPRSTEIQLDWVNWTVPREFLEQKTDYATLTYNYGGQTRTWNVPVTYEDVASKPKLELFYQRKDGRIKEEGSYPLYTKTRKYHADWPTIPDRFLGNFTVRAESFSVVDTTYTVIEKTLQLQREFEARKDTVPPPPAPTPPAKEGWFKGQPTGKKKETIR